MHIKKRIVRLLIYVTATSLFLSAFATFNLVSHASSTQDFLIYETSLNYAINKIDCGQVKPYDCVVALTGRVYSYPYGWLTYTAVLSAQWSKSFANGRGGYCSPAGGIAIAKTPKGSLHAMIQGNLCNLGPSDPAKPHVYNGSLTLRGISGTLKGTTGKAGVKGGNNEKNVAFFVDGSVSSN